MFFDLLPELADIDAQILRVLGMRRAPDRGENLLVGDDAAGVAGEKRQQLELLRRKLDLCARARGTVAHGSIFDSADAQERVSALRCMRWRSAVRMRAISSPTLNGLLT